MDNQKSNWRTTIALVLSIAALALSGWAITHPDPQAGHAAGSAASGSPLLNAINSGTLVVGYGGYPPYTIIDPNTGKVSGLSVDLVNDIASQLNLKVVWKKFNWTTMDVDIQRGDIDVIADPIFETIPRARQYTFTEPYAFVPTGVGVERLTGPSYPTIAAISNPKITVAVGQGLAEQTVVQTLAPKATIIPVPITSDSTAAANLVLEGRADVAILTLSDAQRVLAANPGVLKGLWLNNPPAYEPAGFALQLGDNVGAGVLNTAIDNLRYNGTLAALARKYSIQSDFNPSSMATAP